MSSGDGWRRFVRHVGLSPLVVGVVCLAVAALVLTRVMHASSCSGIACVDAGPSPTTYVLAAPFAVGGMVALAVFVWRLLRDDRS